jgi:3-hydroxyisobutyrate dehydrogenase-like beta-hydroxyacid dehydrogenase
VTGALRECEKRKVAEEVLMSTTIGFIGLGTMEHRWRGVVEPRPCAQRLARRPDAMRPLLTAGAVACESATHVAEASDVIITMVTDTEAVQDVILGEHGIAVGARPGRLVIDQRRSSPCWRPRELDAPNIAREIVCRLFSA